MSDDDLFDDVPGEVALPANLNDEAPEFLSSIWDDPHIVRVITEKGSKEWKCLWCGWQFKGQNATKALNHVAKITGQNVRVCIGNICVGYRQLYRVMLEKSQERRSSNQSRDSKFESLQDRHDRAAMMAHANAKSSKSSSGKST